MTAAMAGLLVAMVLLLGVGTFFVLRLGVGELRRLREWEARAARVRATVLRHEARTYKGNTHHRPVVRVATAGGEDVVVGLERWRSAPEPTVGSTLEVLHDPARPQTVRLPGQDRAGAWFMIVVGSVFVLGAAVVAAVLLA